MDSPNPNNKMIKTYTYKIKINKQFEEKFNQWIGACRFLYNCALELKIDTYRRFGKRVSNYEICKQLTEAKQEQKWLYDISNQTLQATLDRLDNAYNKFFKKQFKKNPMKFKYMNN